MHLSNEGKPMMQASSVCHILSNGSISDSGDFENVIRILESRPSINIEN